MYDAINCHPKSLNFGTFISNGGHLFFIKNRIMHNKFCVIDSNIVITGSYNWTYAAEHLNAENIIILDDKDTAVQFEEQFKVLHNEVQQVQNYEPIDTSHLPEESIGEINKEIRLKSDYGLNMQTVQPPRLEEDSGATEHSQRLGNISIGTIFRGPLTGQKYIHAKFWIPYFLNPDFGVYIDFEVDIIDDIFVKDVRQYFHKKDGGLIDDNRPLKPIPKEIYDFEKYKFSYVNCWFKKGGHLKLKTYSDSIVGKEDNPYKYDQFHTLIRYNDDRSGYAIYKSMHEACRLICRSLFNEDVSSDIGLISDSSYTHGIFRLRNEDDIRYITPIYSKFYGNKKKDEIIRKQLQTTPENYWIEYTSSYAKNVLSGFYSNNKCTPSTEPKDAKWFIIQELVSDNEYGNDTNSFISRVIEDIRKEGRKGIVINDDNVKKTLKWENLGFKKSPVYPFRLYREFD